MVKFVKVAGDQAEIEEEVVTCGCGAFL